nr:uncharacterized protein LOC113802646 [Penaeus vannamei]
MYVYIHYSFISLCALVPRLREQLQPRLREECGSSARRPVRGAGRRVHQHDFLRQGHSHPRVLHPTADAFAGSAVAHRLQLAVWRTLPERYIVSSYKARMDNKLKKSK